MPDTESKSREDVALNEIRDAMRGEVRLGIVRVFFGGPHHEAVQIEERKENRWRKVGPVLFPPDGGTTLDTITMLLDFRSAS